MRNRNRWDSHQVKFNLWMEATVVAIIILLLVGFCFGSYYWQKTMCEQQGVSFEDVDYGLISQCMVKHDGKWLPLDNIRGFD